MAIESCNVFSAKSSPEKYLLILSIQDEEFLAFRDIQPQAPKHLVIIPKSHITSITQLTNEQQGLVGRLTLLAKELAERGGISASGYRLAMNCGADGGQFVPHLHPHFLGGRRLSDQFG